MTEETSKKISLIVNHKLLSELYKLVGRQQFIRGERITLTEFINNILTEYVNSHKSSEEDGDHARH